MSGKSMIRCAIYTRKSTEEGLDQEFNSLDAQHEACSAYIASQRHEGWKPISNRYDDGGVSGGTLERPALQRLLDDIDAGRVGMVVVYKIDRLTRSLADFAKLVERLEAAGCSFVSVTQAFNTSSSMGRLTLNVLLSFAQFEREVTAERIRDKIAASKKKGMWMGGIVPLGYERHPDPTRRELVINESEAKQVQDVFQLYKTHGCLRLVESAANARGIRSKRRTFASGRTSGGGVLSRGQIHYLLTNPIYAGLIRHKDKTWPGLHTRIIEEPLWESVQTNLRAASARPRGKTKGNSRGTRTEPLLVGKFRDETGDRLTPSHTNKSGRRFRYYVSNRLLSGETSDAVGWRLPAESFEATVSKLVASHIETGARLHRILQDPDTVCSSETSARAIKFAKNSGSQISQLISSGTLSKGSINITMDSKVFADALGVPDSAIEPNILNIDAPLVYGDAASRPKSSPGKQYQLRI